MLIRRFAALPPGATLALTIALAVAVAFVAVGVAPALLQSRPKPVAEIHVGGSMMTYTLEDLARQADLVAVVETVDVGVPRWNSASGKRWQTRHSDQGAENAYVYRDDVVRVTGVLKGDPQTPVLRVRAIGGQVDDVRMTHDNGYVLEPGGQYLMFLIRAETPLEHGRELAWVAVSLGHGVFTEVGPDEWQQSLGLIGRITTDQVERAASASR